MYLKKLLVFIIGLLFLFSGKNIVSQEMEFPEDKVHYIISAEQNRQLSQYSLIYYKKTELNTKIYDN